MKFTPDQFTDLARTSIIEDADQKMADILNGTLDPYEVEEIEDYCRQYYHPPKGADIKLIAFDILFDCHGTEGIRVEGEWLDNYHGDIIASYVNTGDTYSTTLVHDHETNELILTTYGDWLEAWEQTHERETVED